MSRVRACRYVRSCAVLGNTWNQAVADLENNPATKRVAAWFKCINWEQLGDEFLISIGAAYWHDLLRELTSFRQS